jgi:acyl-coenzyme A synthetase/AMP-(fatty) acid ligase
VQPRALSAGVHAAAPQVERVLLRASLPRTASNKVMRRLLRDEAMGSGAQLRAKL